MQSLSEVAEKLPEHSRFAVYELHCHACRSDFRCAVDLAHVADCPVCGNVSRIQVAHFMGVLMSKA